MATSLSLSNFLSFLLPSNPPPPPPKAAPLNNLYLSSQKPKNTFLSVSAQEDQSSSLSTELSAVICPSLAYANTLFFKSAYNVQVIVDDNEPEERLLNRFRREVMRAGVIQECKRRRFFENKQDEKKRKSREAAKRNRRRRPQARSSLPNKQEVSSKKRDDDEEDNWEMPDGDLPY
ncbi:Ribosomal protein S21 family protein isoform 1 [Theobroma cacao]|uniref:Ribosomal protein S21 family protein isoform 1 n=1 Tax=Theobroma cacao TaxID=3641 RepID=A0A061EDT6_THECC|nr:Ribosomal protein S21 family protein isoform 1 [Theobroma cacao]EOY02779.1 Ribosomal protein S21 family protein isoform 1 [Theobroma cacao]